MIITLDEVRDLLETMIAVKDDSVELMEDSNGDYFGIIMSNGVGMGMSVKNKED